MGEDRAQRGRVLAARGPFSVGRHNLSLIPWTRQSNEETVKMFYRVRVCLEGVPRHGWQIETIKTLFHHSTLIEGVDDGYKPDKETACFCVWVDTNRTRRLPASVCGSGRRPRMPSPRLEPSRSRSLAFEASQGPAVMLQYEVLLHIAVVLDYSPLPDSPGSYNSYQSGMPMEEDEWPARHPQDWYLGYEDGYMPAPQVTRRISALE